MSKVHKVWTRILFGFVLAALAFCPRASAQQLTSCDAANPSTPCIQKFVDAPFYPPFMLPSAVNSAAGPFDRYEIAARQFQQQVLSTGTNDPNTGAQLMTTVWGFGQSTTNNGFPYDPAAATKVCAGDGTDTAPCFLYPAPSLFTTGRGGFSTSYTHVKWTNDLVCHQGDPAAFNCVPGAFFPYPGVTHPGGVVPSFDNHRANPTGVCNGRTTTPSDCKGIAGYTGAVPMVVHAHGAISSSQSDGIPEAWFLPANSKAHFPYPSGSDYCQEAVSQMVFDTSRDNQRDSACDNAGKVPNTNTSYTDNGTARYLYTNRQFGTTLFFHDHALGVTTENVYMGLAGFYLIQGIHTSPATWCNGIAANCGSAANPFNFADDLPSDCAPASTCLGGGASVSGGLPQGDCSFGANAGIQSGNCFFLPLAITDKAFNLDGSLKFSENGNTIVVNGKTWPILNVQPRKYRVKIVIAAPTSRFDFTFPTANNNENGAAPPVATITQIGADAGYLPHPAKLTKPLSLMPGERADMIVDFSQFWFCAPPLGAGCAVDLLNNNGSGDTGVVMRFNIVQPPSCDPVNNFGACFPPIADTSCNLAFLTCTSSDTLPNRASEPAQSVRQVSLFDDHLGNCPVAGCVNSQPLPWDGAVTETPSLFPFANQQPTEIWEMYDFMDTHPMHLHLAQFQVVNREDMRTHVVTPPGPGETGFKDTVQAHGGQITRVRVTFRGPFGPTNLPNPDQTPELHNGLFAWHCHINPHEDNEMMRPVCVLVGDTALGANSQDNFCLGKQ